MTLTNVEGACEIRGGAVRLGGERTVVRGDDDDQGCLWKKLTCAADGREGSLLE